MLAGLLFVCVSGPFVAVAQHTIPWHHVVCDEDFSASQQSKYVIGGDAFFSPSEGRFYLTPAEPHKAGRFFIPERYNLENFKIRFDAFFGDKSRGGGADGIVAAFARTYTYPLTGGGDLNFTGSNGYGVEFDTHKNPEQNDPSEEHMAVIQNTPSNHLHSELFAAGELEDNDWHTIRIENANGTVTIHFDNVQRLIYTIPGFTSFQGYFGFTSATGNAFNTHQIDDIRITVPSRTMTSFGTLVSCRPVTSDVVTADTLVRIHNNDPDGGQLMIDSVVIANLSGAGEFRLTSNPAPGILPYDGYLDFPVRFSANLEGQTKAIMTFFAANGERVIDTLVATVEVPKLRWSSQTVNFPATHVGAYSEELVYLINDGGVPATINGILPSWEDFTVMRPLDFPQSIGPGDTLEVLVRYSPSYLGGQNALLKVAGFCGMIADALLIGNAYATYTQFEFESNLMLRPGEEGTQTVLLKTLPSGLPLNEFSFYIEYDPVIVRYLSTLFTRTIIPSSATIEISAGPPGKLHVYIWTQTPIAVAGPVFGIRFADNAGDFACGEIRIDTVILNQTSEFPGVPFSRGDTSTTCINASCRVPGGIHRVVPPEMKVAPNPFSSATQISIITESDIACSITLADAQGRRVMDIFDGLLPAGTHNLGCEMRGLSKGVYFVLLESRQYSTSRMVVFE